VQSVGIRLAPAQVCAHAQLKFVRFHAAACVTCWPFCVHPGRAGRPCGIFGWPPGLVCIGLHCKVCSSASMMASQMFSAKAQGAGWLVNSLRWQPAQ
jgi:hypothetical protein